MPIGHVALVGGNEFRRECDPMDRALLDLVGGPRAAIVILPTAATNENPYVAGSRVSPRRGRRYLDRSDVRPGMIVDGDIVVRAFRRIGWEWGGHWRTAKDYQHFSATGR